MSTHSKIWWRSNAYHYQHGRVIARELKTGRFISHEAAHIAFAVFGLHCGMRLEVLRGRTA